MRGVEKTFRIPTHRVDSFKERAVHPLRRSEYREQRALRDVSFDVHQGEFLGIVGRNGSGKSTLLKIMSSIYQADGGRIRVAGRLAPFIELGVGFNPEMTSRDNVVLNGVMMGLGRREAQRRLDAVLDFAGLREFADLKLKNYSSGMMVRLAFAVMVEADADIMLVDEVLAVGDAEFAQKCMDVFQERRRAGRTLVLVTHDMATVESLGDRAMLMEDGELAYLGDPEETALRYFRVNFAREHASPEPRPLGRRLGRQRPARRRLARERRRRARENVEQGDPIGCGSCSRPAASWRRRCSPSTSSTRGGTIFGFNRRLGRRRARVPAGRARAGRGTIGNPLLPGRYFVQCFVARSRQQGDSRSTAAAARLRRLRHPQGKGIVAVDADVEAEVEP